MDYTRDRRILVEAEAAGEPVICFRAKDLFAMEALDAYRVSLVPECDSEFVRAIEARQNDFETWRLAHWDVVKIPDLRPDEVVR